MGDFNCVVDVAMDTHRSANTPYENTGADVLTFIKVYNKLEDQMRLQLGYHFNLRDRNLKTQDAIAAPE
eukprot:3145535-Pleurochrysis_carterae.AAC.2